ncbi:4-phosphopantetheinyl transferase domain [Sesbania bispinosa]|nr:4-phosphopantetheinyl transferase domain [Sesbania bispinosa]
MEDRKRALISRMLQYALVHDVIKIPFREIIIKRTFQGKPYLDYDKFGLRFPNFNFNVSHHGDYVAIASEPVCLVGIDIVSYAIPKGETVTEFIQSFSSYFSSLEWNKIVSAGTSDDVLIEFYSATVPACRESRQLYFIVDISVLLVVFCLLGFRRYLLSLGYWSLKEAYVKAIGSGLTEGLNKVEFSHTSWANISAKMDGKVMTEWRFWLFELGERHCDEISFQDVLADTFQVVKLNFRYQLREVTQYQLL